MSGLRLGKPPGTQPGQSWGGGGGGGGGGGVHTDVVTHLTIRISSSRKGAQGEYMHTPV